MHTGNAHNRGLCGGWLSPAKETLHTGTRLRRVLPHPISPLSNMSPGRGPKSIRSADDGGPSHQVLTERRFPNLGLTRHTCLDLVNHDAAYPNNGQTLRMMTVGDDQVDGIFDGMKCTAHLQRLTLGFRGVIATRDWSLANLACNRTQSNECDR